MHYAFTVCILQGKCDYLLVFGAVPSCASGTRQAIRTSFPLRNYILATSRNRKETDQNERRAIMRLSQALTAVFVTTARAACECGYQVTGDRGEPWIFTQALESDFTKLSDLSEDSEWIRQQFNVTAEAGHGKYGKTFSLANITPQSSNPTLENDDGGGIELHVGSQVNDGSITVAEIDTARLDLFWGSYRAGIKVTNVEGTCGAFFWYFNDTQEIDMEFLSREFDREKEIFPVNLVVQSEVSAQAGYDASHTGTYKTVNLGFDPTQAFHEYRFDYMRGKVFFYADSKLLAEMEGHDMPNSSGHLILQHWSNGNPKWSGGPPEQDAVMTVSYVKAYFNSSDPRATKEAHTQCAHAGQQKCHVKDVTAANASTGGEFLTIENGGPNGAESQAARAQVHWSALTVLATAIVTALSLTVTCAG